MGLEIPIKMLNNQVMPFWRCQKMKQKHSEHGLQTGSLN